MSLFVEIFLLSDAIKAWISREKARKNYNYKICWIQNKTSKNMNIRIVRRNLQALKRYFSENWYIKQSIDTKRFQRPLLF